MLYDNEVFSQFLQPISMTALLTTACAYCGLAKSRWIFWLGGLVAVALVLVLSVEPLVEFIVDDLPLGFSLNGQHQRFLLACPAATFIMCLPYRSSRLALFVEVSMT
jgi:hypothetical protein